MQVEDFNRSVEQENLAMIEKYYFQPPAPEEKTSSLSPLRIPSGFRPSTFTYTKKVDLRGKSLGDVLEKTTVSTRLPVVYLKQLAQGTFFAKVHRPAVVLAQSLELDKNNGLCFFLRSVAPKTDWYGNLCWNLVADGTAEVVFRYTFLSKTLVNVLFPEEGEKCLQDAGLAEFFPLLESPHPTEIGGSFTVDIPFVQDYVLLLLKKHGADSCGDIHKFNDTMRCKWLPDDNLILQFEKKVQL